MTPPTPPTSTNPTEQLIDALEAGGELVDEGHFSIDLEQARAKLRAYQLGEPGLYACLLVEASVLAGAERIDFQLRDAELGAHFAGEPFTPEEIENLLSSVFVDVQRLPDEAARRRARARQQLAIAVNGALALGAVEVVVESSEVSGRGARLRIAVEDGVEQITSKALTAAQGGAASRTHVRACFPDKLFDDRPEGELLRRVCRCSRYSIWIDSVPIASGYSAAFDDVRREVVEWSSKKISIDGVYVGRAVNCETDAPAYVDLLVNGWLTERIDLDDEPAGYRACVEVDLRRDLSQQKLLRGPELDAVLDVVRGAFDEIRRAPGRPPPPRSLAPYPNFSLRSLEPAQFVVLWVAAAFVLTIIITTLANSALVAVFGVLACWFLPLLAVALRSR